MKHAALYLGLAVVFGAVPTMAQNTTPDGTPARSCLYALKDGTSGSIPVAAGTASTDKLCDQLGDKQYGKANYQVKGRQCVWPGGETGDADHTTDYTNACSTAWVLGQ